MPANYECTLCHRTLVPDCSDVVDPFSGNVFGVWRCPGCGLGQTIPVPSDVGAFYAPTYHGGRHGASEGWANRRRMRMLEQVVRPGSTHELVDVGCGDGSFLRAAQRGGWRVSGTELQGGDDGDGGLRIESSLGALHDVSPRVATLWHSLEHLPDPVETMRTLRQMLAPDGTVLIAVPNSDSAQARLLGRWWLHLDVPRHLFHWGPRSLDLLLTGAGFEPVKRWNLELEYDVVGWAQSLLSFSLRRHASFFDLVTGRPCTVSGTSLAGQTAAGLALSLICLPLIPVTTALGRGSSVVIAARVKA